MTISVVIPVYRAEGTLRELHRRLVNTLEGLNTDFEIVFVEDCGGDGSWDLIRELANQDSRVKGLRMSRNFGQHSALLCGVRAASHEVVVTLDDDLQNPPEEIPKLVAKLEEGYDMVYGTREHERHGLFRNLASQITKWVLQSAWATAQLATSAPSAPSRQAFADYHSPRFNLNAPLNLRHDVFRRHECVT